MKVKYSERRVVGGGFGMRVGGGREVCVGGGGMEGWSERYMGVVEGGVGVIGGGGGNKEVYIRDVEGGEKRSGSGMEDGGV
ncbi:hypothetical protein, partial [Bacillus altitudinis]|uniref:hypothetical protein n=1 Tax=Bacillus altitudinis TaxID=293387 RepID=UPI001C92F4F9